MVERKLAKAYLKFYTRPTYLLKHRYMVKVMLQTVLRSFILPKLTGTNSKGWYQKLDNENSSK
jgi:anaerobic magnesium-protoporphyrin IX monomethyl ester cyclase